MKIGDREYRYVVAHLSSKHKGNDVYFDTLYKSFDEKALYDNFFTFFMNGDLNQRETLMTEMKKAI